MSHIVSFCVTLGTVSLAHREYRHVAERTCTRLDNPLAEQLQSCNYQLTRWISCLHILQI